MGISTSAGVKIYIGGTGAIASESSWSEIGDVQEIPAFGASFSLVTAPALGENLVRKLKGIRDAGGGGVTINFDTEDTGQDALRVAANDSTSNAYNFKIELNDALSTSGTPTTFTFKAIVMGSPVTIGGQDTVVTQQVELQVTTVPTQTDAT
jgi:hypothetical protein